MDKTLFFGVLVYGGGFGECVTNSSSSKLGGVNFSKDMKDSGDCPHGGQRRPF